jgi:hypothetical protein
MCEIIYFCISRDVIFAKLFNLVKFLIKHLMEEEGGAKVGYSLEVHSSNETSRTSKFLSLMVV